MKKVLCLLSVITLTAIALTACGGDDDITWGGGEVEPKEISVAGVQLDRQMLRLATGATTPLIATVTPANADNPLVTWESDNNAAAMVDGNGLVTAMAEGIANITATTEDGGFRSACEVTVTAAAPDWAATKQIWVIGDQMWSDVINDPACADKTDFIIGEDWDTTPVCRNNYAGFGYLYNWDYVVEYETALCPNDWSVPTKEDFIALDIALGGTGANAQYDLELERIYMKAWGGQFGGYVSPEGNLIYQNEYGNYWSKSEHTALYAYYLSLAEQIYPQLWSLKNTGYALRCIKTSTTE